MIQTGDSISLPGPHQEHNVMSLHKVVCSHCNALLQTAKALPLGKQVKCPHCQQMFTVRSGRIEAPVAKPAMIGGPAPSGSHCPCRSLKQWLAPTRSGCR